MRQSVISGDWFCLGALEETSDQDKGEPDERVAAGVLLFSSEDGISYGELPVNMILLRWIYVAPGYRQKGIGNELMVSAGYDGKYFSECGNRTKGYDDVQLHQVSPEHTARRICRCFS